MRTGTTSPGPSPTGRRPRLRSCSTGYPRSASSAHVWIIPSVTGTPLIFSSLTSKSYYEIEVGGRSWCCSPGPWEGPLACLAGSQLTAPFTAPTGGIPHQVDLWGVSSDKQLTPKGLQGMLASLVEAVLPGAQWRAVLASRRFLLRGFCGEGQFCPGRGFCVRRRRIF